MNVASVSSPGTPGRHFSNATLLWKINNLSLAVASQKFICSPQITLSGPFETTWRLSLEISKEKEKALLYLEMLPNNVWKGRVKVGWASFILDDEEEYVMNERPHYFQPDCKLVVHMFRLEVLFGKLYKMPSDDLQIKCLMLVNFGFDPVFPRSRVEGVMALSNDLSKLPKGFLYHNIIVDVNNVDFSLNWAMLCHRSQRLLNITKHPSAKKVKLTLWNAKAAAALFSYLYTGDLAHILSAPSITIWSYLKVFSISELKDIYPVEVIKIDTRFGGKDYAAKWTISNLSDVTEKIPGPELIVDDIQSRWQFYIYPKSSSEFNEAGNTYLHVEAALSECKKPLDVCFDVVSIKDDTQIVCTRRTQGKMTVGSKLDLKLFQKGGSEMRESFANDCVSFCLKIRIATGQDVSFIPFKTPPLSMPMNNDRSFMIFSKMMGLLKQYHDYSDFQFEVEDEVFKTHKFLIAARSRIFRTILKSHKGTSVLRPPSCKKNVFRVFYTFLYIGIITETDVFKLMELYDMGDMYEICSLKNVCSNLLHNLLSKENVLRVLVWADDRKEIKIRSAALQLIMELAETIRDDPDWNFFRSTKPEIYRIVRRYLP